MAKFITLILLVIFILTAFSMASENDEHLRAKRRTDIACNIACCNWGFADCGICSPKKGYTGSKSCGAGYVCTCRYT
uniref:Uncharacterized protein n=1 Tax=Panagrolaimus sp. ES5 TaxID=591445 RepID=A0AC34GSJ5_9BILA